MAEERPAPIFDVGNALLAEGPAQLTTGVIDTPRGKRLVVTIRTASATVTVMLSREDARNWAALLQSSANGMGALVVPTLNGVPGLNDGKPAGRTG